MNVRKMLGGLAIALFIVCAASGQQLKMKRSGSIVRVMQAKKVLYQVALRGKENEKGRSYDEAFLAGGCLIVRRDVRVVETGTEASPEVSRLEIYRANGKRRIYRQADLGIRSVDRWNVINSPDFAWAIVTDASEGIFQGYFHISTDCRLSEVPFFPNFDFDWFGADDRVFIDAATLKFPALSNRPPDGPKKKMDIYITKDGKYRLKVVE
jgi:hypothetical protein